MMNNYWQLNEATNTHYGRRIFHLVYKCMHCDTALIHFYVLIDSTKKTFEKVGQYPAWDISGNKDLERRLAKHAQYPRRGLICESQGYGIGAFGYYRRIVEEIIDHLLDDISELLAGPDLEKYAAALQQTKTTRVAQDKIALVKDLLPKSLRPDGKNPLDLLHSVLSEGLHAKSDEECLGDSEVCRSVLVFLVGQIEAHKNSTKEFSNSMKTLLDKRAKKNVEESR